MLALFLYDLLLFLLSPLIALFLLVRLARGKEDKTHWSERWGMLPPQIKTQTGSPRIWVHAVSVGEVMAAAPVLRELRAKFPDALILLSTTTIGGREVAQKQIPPADGVAYYPLDFLPCVWMALSNFRPDAVVLMEWEIWPNFLTVAKQKGAKIAVFNGRISDKGLRRGLRAKFWTRPALQTVDVFAMQSAEDARRAVRVGAPPDRVQTVGNTKFDESVHALTRGEVDSLRADLGISADAPVWVCGSTRPGEEVLIAEAFALARKTVPDLFLIVAPRHLDRANEAMEPFVRAGFAARRRSEASLLIEAPTPSPSPATGEGSSSRGLSPLPTGATLETPLSFSVSPLPSAGEGLGVGGGPLGGKGRGLPTVLILDTFGELARVYAVADVAFVGGSLFPFGGQSVFQPLAQGTPAVFGPFMNNQRDIAALSQSEGVGFMVNADAPSLATEVLRLLQLPTGEKAALREKARNLIARNQGVSATCAQIVAGLLSETGEAKP